MLPVYIQKKIDEKWCTLMPIDSVNSSNVLDHLCRQHCKDLYRISLEKTDDMPFEKQGLSREECLDALYHVELVGLTEKKAMEALKRIVSVVCEIDKWHKH